MSVSCGSASEIHKQMDDSSIHLRYKGVDLIVDSGAYLYDATDRFRKCVQSSTGHSGLYLKQFDGIPRHEILAKYGPFRGQIVKFEELKDGVRLACTYSILDDAIVVNRYIYVIWDNEIVIVDKVNGDASDAVQRFIFGSQVNVSTKKNHLKLDANGVSCTLFHTASGVDLYKEEDTDSVTRGCQSSHLMFCQKQSIRQYDRKFL
ncbi:heparinase II/III domain-containing protein [Streptomyces albidoflavus]